MKAQTLLIHNGHADYQTFDFPSPSAEDLAECAIFLSKEGIAYDESETALPFSFLSMPRPSLERALHTTVDQVFQSRKHSFVVRDDHTYVPGLVPGYWNYYHLLIDCLPRILLSLRSAGVARRVLITRFQDARLQSGLGDLLVQIGNIFGFREQIDVADADLLHLKSAIIPKQRVRFISATMQMYQDVGTTRIRHAGTRRRIYISRKLTTARRVVNEAEVLLILHRMGFQPMCLEEMSLEEQIDVFRTSEVIIGPHGAGLANIVFSNPGTILIEFLQESALYKSKILSELTVLAGGKHVVISSKPEANSSNPAPPSNVDMWVDCFGLHATLKSLLG